MKKQIYRATSKPHLSVKAQSKQFWKTFLVSTCIISLAVVGMYQLSKFIGTIPPLDENKTPVSEITLPVPPPTVTTVSFAACGDNLIHDGLYLQAQRRAGGNGYDFKALYENVAPFFKDYDISWINQETLVTNELAPSSYPAFCSPENVVETLYDIGFRVFALSNNHTYDKGALGISATRRFWNKMPDDTLSPGLYAGEADVVNISLQTVNDITFAYLPYTESTNGIPTPTDTEANIIYTTQTDVIKQQIELARTLADVVVPSVHWGIENSTMANEEQRALAQQMADWGADIILGTHPHVVQPIEIITAETTGKQVPVVYSLGNFVSTQKATETLLGMIATFEITKTTPFDGESTVSIGNLKAVPVVMHYDANYSNARVYLYRDYTEEMAATHGARANNAVFTKAYLQQILEKTISDEFLSVT